MIKREQIEPLCQLGYTQKRIANELGQPRTDVNYYMTKYGLSTGRKASNRKLWNESERETLVGMVSSGLTNTAIGKALGINRDTVRTYLNIYGIHRESYVPHPDLKEDFFERIDTKEKAYWLGFLYADGYVTRDGAATVLDLCEKDADWVHKFCEVVGVSHDRVKARTHKKGYRSISVRIQSRQFTEHLVRHGCVNAKSKIIRLPELGSEELDMAFLMGYYDGDGTANGTEVCSGSIEFLKDIVIRFDVRTKLSQTIGKVSKLTLGADLKRRLVMNYPDGMLRKHQMFSGDKGHKLKGTKPRPSVPRKFNVDKKELERLISEYTYVEIGKKFNVSDNSIKKRARVLGIELIRRKTGPRKKMEPCK